MVLRAWAEDITAPIERVTAALSRLRDDPTALGPDALDDEGWVALLGASGTRLEELCELADTVRARVTDPDAVTFVVNRNLDTGVAARLISDERRPGEPALAELVGEAVELGATEICMQGPLPADRPATDYVRLVAEITDAAAGLHLHAYRAAEIADGAVRTGVPIVEHLRRLRAAGLGSIPGTAAQILDDSVRGFLSPTGSAPAREWIEVIEAAHGVGLFSTATIVYGHVETPEHQVAHLRTLLGIQRRTGGFSELILMPMVASNTPPHLTAAATSTASQRETRALHAVARLMSVGLIDHVQVAWTKLDPDTVDLLLRGGADDIGGLLLDGRLMPDAGPEVGRVLDADTLVAIAERAGRTPRQRTTRYAEPEAHRLLPIPQVRS
ncbi:MULTISPECIES: FO synthase [Gordonia]|nr:MULTISPECIES: FO synthase [Gordonia]ETA07357.1 FO synthase [Gordonia alkanivorans CGMCC 6845]MDH3007742.1 FO synthase [Gordonia alkanivorans]MDH3015455.1 FO synthase [Gordonia alkanivorans]MDH3020190.1 FO synthase [Gordonia alkanivorans]MDH3040396.1 FO synthase [Gordonia alkanivorans]